MPVCANCGETKAGSEFSSNQKSKGVQRQCRDCVGTLPGARQDTAPQIPLTSQLQSETDTPEPISPSVFPPSSASGMFSCTSCKTKKPSWEFSAAQISKGAQKIRGTQHTRRCIVCVHVSAEDQRSSKQSAVTSPNRKGATKQPEANSLRLLCGTCKTTRPSAEFSRPQKSKGSERKCLVCMFWSNRPKPKKEPSGILMCAMCQERQPCFDFSGAELSKGNQRACFRCSKRASAPSKLANSVAPEAKCQVFNWSEDFRMCHAGIPEKQRLRTLRRLIDKRIVPGREASFASDSLAIQDRPSIFMNCGYTREAAAPADTPSDPAERAALAKALVDYGEAVGWERKVHSMGHLYWTCRPLGKPSGPPLVRDLVQVQVAAAGRGPDSVGRSPFAGDSDSRLTGTALVAAELLQLKGLVHRSDIASNTPAQAGSGLWAFRDPPLVRYARAGSTAMVAAMVEAGAAVDQSLMWRETSWNGDTHHHWKGDSALMAAARQGHAVTCAVLLHYGASTEHVCCYDEDCYDQGPAAAARRSHHPQIAALIEGYQAGQPVDASLNALMSEARMWSYAPQAGAAPSCNSRILLDDL